MAVSFKHRAKVGLVGAWSSATWFSGLAGVIDRVRAPRLTVLYGHCVADQELNGSLHEDMKIGADKLSAVLRALGERHDLVTIAEGMDRLRSGAEGRSMVALSMDDGYRDNLLRLVPLLEAVGAKATVFLEAGAVCERRLPWLHTLGAIDGALGPAESGARLAEHLPAVADALREVRDSNRLKRILKYDADRNERDRALAGLLEELGLDPRDLVDQLYLSREEAKELSEHPSIEVGGHTVDHPVLSRLPYAEQLDQVSSGRSLLGALLGPESGRTFAYPYGRDWDRNADSCRAVAEAGYEYAVTTHEGFIEASAEPYALRRIPIHGGTQLHRVGAVAAGALRQRSR